MLGVIYLGLCLCVGQLICQLLWPDMKLKTNQTFKGKEAHMPSFFVLLPAWFISGMLPMVWCTYLSACITKNLMFADMIAFAVAIVFLFLGYLYLKRRENTKCRKDSETEEGVEKETIEEAENLLENRIGGLLIQFRDGLKKYWFEEIYIILVFILAVVLMFITFHVSGGKICIGRTVHSDFSPHMAMIRSFSLGNNFPTEYPHFAGEDIKYHFMFLFLAGNLEFLGMPIDWAFNVPSVISFVCLFMMLYALTYRITEKKFIAVLTGLFFAFRSSFAVFDFMKQLPVGEVWQGLWSNLEFIGTTAHEDWGLYNLNVYVNQRHLALGMTILLFVVYQMIDHYYLALERHQGKNILSLLKDSFISKKGWSVTDPVAIIGLGVLLGMTGFFHGSCVIACLLILFVLAIVSDHRLDYLIIAVITLVLVMAQTRFFTDGSVMSVQWLFGYLAESKTIPGVLVFLVKLMGIFPMIILIMLLISKFEDFWLIIAFSAPLVFAFTISMTPDIAVNHKYIMMSEMLLGIFAAKFIDMILSWRKSIGTVILCAGMIFTLTCTGMYELNLILRKDYSNIAIYEESTSAIEWIKENTTSRAMFLTFWDTYNPVLWAGRNLYLGWPYYAWSAGYDTYYRKDQVKAMYEAESPDILRQLVEENNIDYIVINPEVRGNVSEYIVNEDVIRDTFECVFEYEELQIYDTEKIKG